MTVTFIVGLCGSGKTYLANRLKLQQPKLRVFDENFMWDLKQHWDLYKALRKRQCCLVIEVALCDPKMRAKVKRALSQGFKNLQIRWIFFENNVRLANKNCRTRKNKPKGSLPKILKLNRKLTRLYKIPSAYTPKKIFSV